MMNDFALIDGVSNRVLLQHESVYAALDSWVNRSPAAKAKIAEASTYVGGDCSTQDERTVEAGTALT